MVYGVLKDLTRRTASDKILPGKGVSKGSWFNG